VLWLLQARPITALPDPDDEPGAIAVDVPPGEWTRSNYAPEPLSPMFRSLMLPGLHELTENLFPYSIGERIEFCEIGGWLYTRFVKADSPERIKAKLGAAIAAVAADEPADFYRDWFTVSEPRLTARLTELRDGCLPAELSDQDLLDHLDAVHATWRETLAKHFRCGGSGTFVLGELGVTCRDLLGWDAPDTLALLLGLGGKTTEPAYALAGLVAMVRARPWVAELIPTLLESEVDGYDVLDALRGSDRRFADAFAAYQHEYGQRTLGMDITEPTVAERPALVLNLILGQLSRNFDPEADQEALLAERAKAESAARAALAESSTADQERFEQVLGRAQWAHPGRDDSHYLTQLAGGLLRRAVLEVGARLAERELISAVEDVFLLHHFEAHNSLLDDIDRRPLVGDRAAEQAWAIAHPGPESYGTQGGHGFNPADLLATLPPPARRLIEAGLWAWQEVSGERAGNATPVASDGLVLSGIAGSRGRYTGRVRVITSEADFGRLQPGEVLVCPETNPQWAVLFPSIGALVTDHGGLLSHPAIIAREYRVPAVLATGIATKHLRDGQIVDVDGTAGTVEIVVP
jgi:phosphohistidine swiveling domain-containing protein